MPQAQGEEEEEEEGRAASGGTRERAMPQTQCPIHVSPAAAVDGGWCTRDTERGG